ncbi:NADPH-cytochrome P450 reductase [Fusarium falciforme]|nr:NADPH-cytochrome P450 reductase [Fusarium falciforme]
MTAAIASLLLQLWQVVLARLLGWISTVQSRPTARGGTISTNDRCIARKIDQDKVECLVVFGTQSGTAQTIAERLAREAHARFGLGCLVAPFDDYDFNNMSDISANTLVLLVMASYGDGEPTDDACQFYSLLTDESSLLDELGGNGLGDLKFGAFGLGNSTYTHYNKVMRQVNDRLLVSGAQRLGPLGESDDSKETPEETFLQWKEDMWSHAVKEMSLEERVAIFEPSYEVSEVQTQDDRTDKPSTLSKHHGQHPLGATPVPIRSSRSLVSTYDRDCVHVELDLSGSGLCYETGDHLGVWPTNPQAEVERFLQKFGLWEKRKTAISIHRREGDFSSQTPFPSTISVEDLALYHLDICGPVSRQSLSVMVDFVADEAQRTALKQLGADKSQFLKLTEGKYFNTALLLEHLFPGGEAVTVPLAVLLECVPKLQPRFYSISSSATAERKRPTITVSAQSLPVPGTSRRFLGVASNFILDSTRTRESRPVWANLLPPKAEGDGPPSLPVFVRTSSFRLPEDLSVPVLMIGPGTGVAPFRGFIRERVEQKRQGQEIGTLTLFYGCRRADEDFLYKEEWSAYRDELGDKFQMHVAFSRQTEKKVYVQDILMEKWEEVTRVIRNNGAVYVCGDVRMGKGVYSTLRDILIKGEGISEDEAEDRLRDMKQSRFYHVRNPPVIFLFAWLRSV